MLVVKSELGDVFLLTDDFVLDEGLVLIGTAVVLAVPSLE